MKPSINSEGDVGIVDLVSFKHLSVQPLHGDILVINSPLKRHRLVIKRVVGLQGDLVYSNRDEGDLALVEVPHGHVWVEGDNQSNSLDSRSYGPVSLGLVQGMFVRLLR